MIFLNTAECTQRLITRPIFMYQHYFYRLFCVCSDKKSSMLFVFSGISLISMNEPLCLVFLSLLWSRLRRNKTSFMKPHMLSNSNIQDISFLRYNVTIIIVIWQLKGFYNILISEIYDCNIQITYKMHNNISKCFQLHFCHQNISPASATIFRENNYEHKNGQCG